MAENTHLGLMGQNQNFNQQGNSGFILDLQKEEELKMIDDQEWD